MEATLAGLPIELSNESESAVVADEEFDINDELPRLLDNVSVKWLYDGVVGLNIVNAGGPSSLSSP